jgi:hypothetical protein
MHTAFGLKKRVLLSLLPRQKWENIGNSHRAPTQVSLAEGLKSPRLILDVSITIWVGSKTSDGPVEGIASKCVAHMTWHIRNVIMIIIVTIFCFHPVVPFSELMA